MKTVQYLGNSTRQTMIARETGSGEWQRISRAEENGKDGKLQNVTGLRSTSAR